MEFVIGDRVRLVNNREREGVVRLVDQFGPHNQYYVQFDYERTTSGPYRADELELV